MPNKKLKIQGLEVKSFVTNLDHRDQVKGGVQQTEWCSNGIVYCTLQTCTLDTNCQTNVKAVCEATAKPHC